jgi:hypothetical protein
VWAEKDKFDWLARGIFAVGAGDHGVVTFFPAKRGVEADD